MRVFKFLLRYSIIVQHEASDGGNGRHIGDAWMNETITASRLITTTTTAIKKPDDFQRSGKTIEQKII